jgi:hypothetical protein
VLAHPLLLESRARALIPEKNGWSGEDRGVRRCRTRVELSVLGTHVLIEKYALEFVRHLTIPTSKNNEGSRK